MENKNCFTGRLDVKAFTLIELLVVVLIIGILAAVALPQYQKAVEKSKAAQAFAMLKTVYNAAEAYYLANGTYATSFDELSVDIPWTGTSGWCSLTAEETRSNADWSVQLYRTSLDTQRSVTVGRLRGKYKGAGFIIFLEDVDSLKKGTLYCAERTANGVNFTAEDGAYCQKMFGGSVAGSAGGGALRVYSMP